MKKISYKALRRFGLDENFNLIYYPENIIVDVFEEEIPDNTEVAEGETTKKRGRKKKTSDIETSNEDCGELVDSTNFRDSNGRFLYVSTDSIDDISICYKLDEDAIEDYENSKKLLDKKFLLERSKRVEIWCDEKKISSSYLNIIGNMISMNSDVISDYEKNIWDEYILFLKKCKEEETLFKKELIG